jgi:hypothetical protein
MFFAVILGIVFVTHLHRYFWHISLFLIFFNFIYRPTGFAFGGLELSCALGCRCYRHLCVAEARHDWPTACRIRLLVPCRDFSSRGLLYIGGHMLYTKMNPYSPADFSLNNALKSYFPLCAPYFLLFYFSVAPSGVTTTRSSFWTICKLCLIGLVINVGLRLYEFAAGVEYVAIPGINAINNLYTLRGVGPLAMLLGTVGLFSRHTTNLPTSRWWISWLLLSFGTLGALISGGRAAVVLGLAFVLLALYCRRKYSLLGVALGAALFGVLAANLFSGWVNNDAHPLVRRSLQWVLLQKSHESMTSIEGSSDWRAELFRRTIAEWNSDPRIFWFGRATFSYGSDDEVALMRVGGYEALLETAQRRGATHNLLSDLLIAYGLVGCVLHFALYLSIIYFLWRLHRCTAITQATSDLALVCFISALMGLLVGLIAGGGLPADIMFVVIVLIASIYNGVGLASSPELPTSDRSNRAVRAATANPRDTVTGPAGGRVFRRQRQALIRPKRL